MPRGSSARIRRHLHGVPARDQVDSAIVYILYLRRSLVRTHPLVRMFEQHGLTARVLDPRRSDIASSTFPDSRREGSMLSSDVQDSSDFAHRCCSALRQSTCLLVLRSTIQFSTDSVRNVEDEGIEPSTLGLQSQCSPAELIPHPVPKNRRDPEGPRTEDSACARGEPSRPPRPLCLHEEVQGRSLKTK